jgi:enoyl-CoA hydratase
MYHAALFLIGQQNASPVFPIVNADRLLVEITGPVLRLTINRPEKRNALSLDLLDELGETLTRNASNPDLRCAVITAAGDRSFAAGGDLNELDAIRSERDAEAMSKRGRAALDCVRAFPLPVVAGLNGLALGGGAELALACDFRIAAPNAEIGFLQGQLNVTTAWGGGIDLIATVGKQIAFDLLITARRVPTDEALSLGMIDRVCESGQSLDDCLNGFLQTWLQRSPRVIKGYKALMTEHKRAIHEQLTLTEQAHFVTTWTHDDHWVAMKKGNKDRE